MKRDRPPAIASFFLQHLRQGSDHILGDLVEGFLAGRSRWWYWRQVIAAIMFGAVSDVSQHKVVTLRALTLGAAFVWFISQFVLFRILTVDEWLFTTGLVKWIYLNHWGLGQWVGPIPATALMFAISGWLVGRTHRRYGASVVLAYVAFTACADAVSLVWRPVTPDPFYPMTQLVLNVLLIYPLSVLLGGMWALSTEGSFAPPVRRRDAGHSRFRARRG